MRDKTVKSAGLLRLTSAFIAIVAVASAFGDAHASAEAAVVHKVGEVTWHAQTFVDKDVTIVGFVLAREKGYVFVSDERTGRVSVHDLPVTGAGIDQLRPAVKYTLQGKLLSHGLKAKNGSPYHLELTSPPEEMK